ncbi:MAG: AMP-binding protein [Anaerolineae bacterium]|nr:AMP-binding protein [Anaerolineae bacterium]
MNSILEAFLRAAERTPQKPCLVFEGQTLTYAELRSAAENFAHALIAWGLRPGDRVALFLENSPDFLIAYLGTWWAGGIVVLVNTAYRQVELRHILNDSGARLCIANGAQRHELDRIRSDLSTLELILEDLAGLTHFLTLAPSQSPITNPQLPITSSVAVIAYTSGTTGRSKGAMLLHHNLIANAQAICQAWRWTERDHLLNMLPLFHVHGLMVGMHGTWVAGASAELHRKFDASLAYQRLLSGDFSLFFGVPTMYTRLIQEAQALPHKPPPLRLYVSGSAPLSAHTFAEFEALFGQKILERYGMTETVMNTTNPYDARDGERRPGTVGQPFPHQEARVVDVRTRQPLPPEITGEIEVRGPHVFAGYLNRPDATAESFDPDGWFRTGDLGQVSADGYFTITGRAKELIITGGYNVYPREVEDVLAQCPGVAEAAVFALPDASLAKCVCAAIVRADPALSANAITTFCKDQLAGYKKPRHIFFVASLPRNAMGKVQKQRAG